MELKKLLFFKAVACWISIILAITPTVSWAQDPLNLRENRNEVQTLPVPATPSTALPMISGEARPVESNIDHVLTAPSDPVEGNGQVEESLPLGESETIDLEVAASADIGLSEDPAEELNKDQTEEENEEAERILIEANIVASVQAPSAGIRIEANITDTKEQANPGPEEQEKEKNEEPPAAAPVSENQPVNPASPETNQPVTVPLPFIFNAQPPASTETALPERRIEEIGETKREEGKGEIRMPVLAEPLPIVKQNFDFTAPRPLSKIAFEADEITFLGVPDLAIPSKTFNLDWFEGNESSVNPETPVEVFAEKISRNAQMAAVPSSRTNILPSWFFWKLMDRETRKREILKRKPFRFIQGMQKEDSAALLTLKIPSIEGVNLRVKQIFEMTPAELEQLALLLGVSPDQIGILIGKLLQILARFDGVDLRTLTTLPVLITFLKEETAETLFSGGATPKGWLFGINKEFSNLIDRLKSQEPSEKVFSVFSQVILLTGLGQSLLPPEISKDNPGQTSHLAKQLLEQLAKEAGLSTPRDQLWDQLIGAVQPGKVLDPSGTILLAKKPNAQLLDAATHPGASELPRIDKRIHRLAGRVIEAGRLVEEGLAKNRGLAASQREASLRKAKDLLKPAHSELQAIKVRALPKNLEDQLTGLLKDQATFDFLIDQSFRNRRADEAARQARSALVKVLEAKTAEEAKAQLKIAQKGQETVQQELTDLVNQPAWIRETVPQKLTDGAVENLSLLRDELNRIVTKVEQRAAEKDFKVTRQLQSDDSGDWMNGSALHPTRPAQ